MAMRAGELLDVPLLELGGGDQATCRDLVQNVLVTGVTGGGKTSGPGRNILTGLSIFGAGGVIACVKPSEAAEVCAILQKAGRGNSVIVWNGRNGAFNLFAYALAQLGHDGLNGVIEYIIRIVEIIRNASPLRGSDGDAHWTDELKRMLRHSLQPVHLATGTIRLRDILSFVRSAPTSLDQMRDEAWQKQSYFFSVMASAATRMDDGTGELLMQFWREYAQMDGKLRSSILAGFTMLDRFNHGWLANAFCGETNIVPALCFHGAIIVLDMPRATMGEDGLIAQMLFIDAFQTEVLGRPALDPIHRQRLVFCYADEFQEIVTSRWAEFLALSRSSLCSTIALTQSLPGLYAKLGSSNAHDRAHHLISNMAVRIFCANSCNITNNFASETIGKAVQRRGTFNENEGTNHSYGSSIGEGTSWNRNAEEGGFFSLGALVRQPNDGWHGPGSEGGGDNWGRNYSGGSSRGTNWGYSEVVDDIVPAAFFARDLKTGGPANGNRVGAILVQAGKNFVSSGGPALYVEFAQ